MGESVEDAAGAASDGPVGHLKSLSSAFFGRFGGGRLSNGDGRADAFGFGGGKLSYGLTYAEALSAAAGAFAVQPFASDAAFGTQVSWFARGNAIPW